MSKIIKIQKDGPQNYTALPVDKIKKIKAIAEQGAIDVIMDDGEVISLTDLSDITTITNYVKANEFKPAAVKKTPVATDQSK